MQYSLALSLFNTISQVDEMEDYLLFLKDC